MKPESHGITIDEARRRIQSVDGVANTDIRLLDWQEIVVVDFAANLRPNTRSKSAVKRDIRRIMEPFGVIMWADSGPTLPRD